jgi:UDP:flavonoid glycosyltransferase YjiC (YdhE family)
VTLGVGLVLADEWLQLAAGAVAKHWEAARVEPRADAGIYRTLYLNQWPRSVQRPLPETVCAAEIDIRQPNVVVRKFIPQGALLDRCQLVVCHGGSGSVLGPLHYGAPLIVIPMGADQLENAERLAAVGVAQAVSPTDLSADAVHETARTIIADETFRHNARAVGDEIATMSTAPELVPVLEALRSTAP